MLLLISILLIALFVIIPVVWGNLWINSIKEEDRQKSLKQQNEELEIENEKLDRFLLQKENQIHSIENDIMEKRKTLGIINEHGPILEILINKVNDAKFLYQSLEDNIVNRTIKLDILGESILNKETYYGIINDSEKLIKSLESDISYKNSILNQNINELTYLETGFYTSEYNFDTTEEYIAKINETVKLEKEMISLGTAVYVNGIYCCNRPIEKKFIKLGLRAFNLDCDRIVGKLKRSYNYAGLKKEIYKSSEIINKLLSDYSLVISKDYIDLKVQLLSLQYEFIKLKELELEQRRQERDDERELLKAQQELIDEEHRLEKEEHEKTERLNLMQKELALNNENIELKNQMQILQLELDTVKANKQRVQSQAELTKSGYIYLISNIGSFGENVYKIGMTRRLDPMERIYELSCAAVPFIFDVHGIIRCDDAPSVEKQIHKFLSKRRVNKINNRKEFFRLKRNELKPLLEKFFPKHNTNIIEIPEAYEYRQGLILNNKT